MNAIDEKHGQNWSIYNADCVLFSQSLPDNCVDLAVYSPPYSSLYVYSESVADMGNVRDDQEFFEQYSYLVKELYRVMRPGRLVACHVKDLVYYQSSSESGYSGLRPFSDGITKAHTDAGFTFHTRITIYRDPVLERSKTNAHGLLWKTFQGDASFCRVGMPEYLMVFRKWAKDGEEDLVKPVTHPKSKVPLETWQDLAGPVWTGKEDDFTTGIHLPPVWNNTPPGQGDGYLSATDVLNAKTARDDKAERHLCPMPMNITKRAIELWTNKGDVVFSPFTGIGSEGVASLEMDRKFIGTELHPNYFNQAASFLELAENNNQLSLLEAA